LIEPVATPTAYEIVGEHIRRAIHVGSFIPGDRLPPERELAATLGVARGTLREALRILQGNGYLHPSRGAGGGYEVLEVPRPRSRGDVEIAGFLSEFQALLDFRLVIETATAARAAQYRTDTDLLRLARAQAALEASRGLATFRQADSAFHLAIATASRNSFLSQAVFDARAAMFLSMDAADPNIILETTVKGHAQILHAVQKGDPAMARSAMTHHIEVTRNEIRKGVLALDKASPSPSPLAASGWPRQPLHEEHADD